MKEKMYVVQLRSTIFLQQNIGYTPESEERFKKLLMPGSMAFGIPQPNMPIFGVNPNDPQYGMPWRLFQKNDEGEYNIAFQPGKIDVVLTTEVLYGGDAETLFCNKSIEWFTKILEVQRQAVTRIAYAPLYAIMKDESNFIWENLLKKTIYDGAQSQDINLSFLLKRIIDFGGKDIQMNLLHNIFDGNQIKNEGLSSIVRKVLLLQLDLNSVPENNLQLDEKGIAAFYNNILDIKCNLIDNVTKE